MVNGESWSTRTVQSHPRCGALRSDCAALYKTDKALGFDTARCAVALKIKLGSRVGSPTVEAPAMGGGSWIGLMGLETFCEFDVRENLYAPPGCLGRQNGEDEYRWVYLDCPPPAFGGGGLILIWFTHSTRAHFLILSQSVINSNSQLVCHSIVFFLLFVFRFRSFAGYSLDTYHLSAKMKFSPTLLFLSATSPLALAIASHQDNPAVPAPSGSGTPVLRRSDAGDTAVNARQRRAMLRMRQPGTADDEAVAYTTEAAAPASTTEPPAEEDVTEEEECVDVEVPDLANGTLPLNGTEGGNGTANGTTLSEQELKVKRMVKVKLPDYRRDGEGVKERDAEAELGVSYHLVDE